MNGPNQWRTLVLIIGASQEMFRATNTRLVQIYNSSTADVIDFTSSPTSISVIKEALQTAMTRLQQPGTYGQFHFVYNGHGAPAAIRDHPLKAHLHLDNKEKFKADDLVRRLQEMPVTFVSVLMMCCFSGSRAHDQEEGVPQPIASSISSSASLLTSGRDDWDMYNEQQSIAVTAHARGGSSLDEAFLSRWTPHALFSQSAASEAAKTSTDEPFLHAIHQSLRVENVVAERHFHDANPDFQVQLSESYVNHPFVLP